MILCEGVLLFRICLVYLNMAHTLSFFFLNSRFHGPGVAWYVLGKGHWNQSTSYGQASAGKLGSVHEIVR